MKQNIDTIGIKYLSPCYLTKKITEKTGVFKNKTNTVERNVDLNFDKMKSRRYPVYVMESMRLDFENEKRHYQNPRISGMRSIEFSLNLFLQQNPSCKIISVIRDGDYRFCIIWEEVKIDG